MYSKFNLIAWDFYALTASVVSENNIYIIESYFFFNLSHFQVTSAYYWSDLASELFRVIFKENKYTIAFSEAIENEFCLKTINIL